MADYSEEQAQAMESFCTGSQTGDQATADSAGCPLTAQSSPAEGAEQSVAVEEPKRSGGKGGRGAYDMTGLPKDHQPSRVPLSRSASPSAHQASDTTLSINDYPYPGPPFTRNSQQELSVSSDFLDQSDRLIAALHQRQEPQPDRKSFMKTEFREMLEAQGDLSEASAGWREEQRVTPDGSMTSFGSLYILKKRDDSSNLDRLLVNSSICAFEGRSVDALPARWKGWEAMR